MCGIAGVIEPPYHGAASSTVLEAMCRVIHHRGPDATGIHLDARVGLGSQRLAIIDLEAGNQPICNENGSIWVVQNGEIYNHVALRRELEECGHRFRTSHADTEVLVHAWEEWGESFAEHLEGMFAIAVWDARAQQLVLARDRIGIKPLYFCWQDGRLIFASEIKAILEHPAAERGIDPQSVYDYLGWEFVPGPATMYRDIKKLMPGHMLVWHNESISVRQWWDITYEPVEASKEEYERRIRDGMRDSVGKRLMSDVPLGVFLSGGMDSTAVLAQVAELTTDKIRTFTIGYADPSFSELEYAHYAAKHYGTEHRDIIIEPITPDLIERCVWHLDEPMTDLSAMPLYLLCKAAREDVVVCLSGEGGDEVFVGYDRYVASKIDRYWSVVPSFLRRGLIEPLVDRLPDQRQKKGAINMLKRFMQGSAKPAEGGAMRWQYFSDTEQDSLLFNEGFRAQIQADPFGPMRRALEGKSFPTRLDRELYTDLRFTMPDSVLMKVDKMSMANSLEVRVPFLDHQLVEYAATLPDSVRFPRLERRAIYKSAVASLLPEKILNRGKQGYSLPIKNWLREDLRDWMIGLFDESDLIREYLRREYIDRLIGEHMAMTHNHNHTLWALINLELWHRAYIRQETPTFAASTAT
jgi:asparagine synthase (glutamine-hydrolysing)